VNDTTRELGGALGVAIVGSVASSLFATRMRPALAHMPAPYAAQAKASVGAAVTIGRHVPGPLGQQLVDTARHTFISGADQAMFVAVAAGLLGAAAAALFLPARARAEATVSEIAEAPAPAPATELVLAAS
jgi:hypothetical protein